MLTLLKTTVRPKMISKKEWEVLAWVCKGKTNPEIAEVLCRSPLTVKRHVQDLLKKTGMSSRVSLVAWAGANYPGLVDWAYGKAGN